MTTGLSGETTGLVLAGGAGRRMQNRDKGLLPWRGEPLAAHAARHLRPLVRTLLISCNRNSHRYRKIADQVIADGRGGYQGPLAGLESASSQITTPLLLVAPCDMPEVPGKVFARLRELLTAAQTGGPDAVYLYAGGRDHYLCLALRAAALAGLADYLNGGERSVRGWLATLDAQPAAIPLPPDTLRNINQLPANS